MLTTFRDAAPESYQVKPESQEKITDSHFWIF